MITVGTGILGFIILVSLFKALKKTKENPKTFYWFSLFTILDVVAFTFMMMNPIFAEIQGEVMFIYMSNAILYVVYFMQISRSIRCGKALNRQVENGTSLKLRQFKKMYQNNLEIE